MRLILAGDVNLMGVTDPTLPFSRVRDTLRSADAVFANLECNLHLPDGHSVDHEGFFADPPIAAAALEDAGIAALGLANNVTYGAQPIAATLACLDAIGIAHTGAGGNLEAARAPALVERRGVRLGVLQRSSVYWQTNHEAAATAAGIAVMRAHTAYQVPMFRPLDHLPPLNRPGIPPVVRTWTDKAYLEASAADTRDARSRADIVVASFHWGLGKDVLEYMREIAHASIDAGADIVIGHGPHDILPVEIYRGRPIFYGLGSFSFHTGHRGRKHGNWIGLMVELDVSAAGVSAARVRFVRHTKENETVIRSVADEERAVQELADVSAKLGARLRPDEDALTLAMDAD